MSFSVGDKVRVKEGAWPPEIVGRTAVVMETDHVAFGPGFGGAFDPRYQQPPGNALTLDGCRILLDRVEPSDPITTHEHVVPASLLAPL